MPRVPAVKVGDGPVHVISANAEQMFLDITPAEAAGLPRYTGEMELTNHSAGIADVAGLSKALASKRRIAGRCRGEGFDRRGMAGRAAVSAAAFE
jgi:hypothetical protein